MKAWRVHELGEAADGPRRLADGTTVGRVTLVP